MTNNHLYRQCPSGSVPYTIRRGDTLDRIASEYNTSLENILYANPILDPYALKVGQLICVPLTPQIYPLCATTNYYVVREGDSLESIASYFNVPYLQLLYSNYGIDPEDLYEDQVLCIPVAPSPVRIDVYISQRRLLVLGNTVIVGTYNIAPENPTMPIPKGIFTILNKQVDPGVEMGARWLGLSEAGFGIQGTNTPEFIDAVSSGNSIVLSNEDVSELFNLVPVGATVRVM